MPRKQVIRPSEQDKKTQDTYNEERLKHEDVGSVDLVAYAGGSINNLPVKSKAFNTWLDAHRSNNPFIGKHVTAAPEEYTEEVRLNDDETLSPEETEAFLNNDDIGLQTFDPNSKFGGEAEELGEALIGDDKHDVRFIDITIAENITNKLLGRPIEEIEKEATKAMQSYYGDAHYTTDIDVSKIIETSTVRLIEQQKAAGEHPEQLKLTGYKE
jgi:hypothetical protein